jgi:hypothetical protein
MAELEANKQAEGGEEAAPETPAEDNGDDAEEPKSEEALIKEGASLNDCP